MKRIKWENIIAILLTAYLMYANITIFIQNGFSFNLFMFELVLDFVSVYAIRFIVKNVRIYWE